MSLISFTGKVREMKRVNPYGLDLMLPRNQLFTRIAVMGCSVAMLSAGIAPAIATEIAVRPVEQVNIEELLENAEPWYRPDRKYRCKYAWETPQIPGNVFKICAYDCLGYGAAATFPWPADLPCPGSFNDLFPPIPSGYPDPNIVR